MFIITFPIAVMCSPVIWTKPFLGFRWYHSKRETSKSIHLGIVKFLILTYSLLPAFSLAVLFCQLHSAPSYSDRKFHIELRSLIKSTCNDLQLLLIGTTAEALLASLPCRIKGGKCQLSGEWLLPAVHPAVVQELHNCVPWGATSAVEHWLWCRAAWTWDRVSLELLSGYSAIPASGQQYSSMLPGTECNRWDNVAEDCH